MSSLPQVVVYEINFSRRNEKLKDIVYFIKKTGDDVIGKSVRISNPRLKIKILSIN